MSRIQYRTLSAAMHAVRAGVTEGYYGDIRVFRRHDAPGIAIMGERGSRGETWLDRVAEHFSAVQQEFPQQTVRLTIYRGSLYVGFEFASPEEVAENASSFRCIRRSPDAYWTITVS